LKDQPGGQLDQLVGIFRNTDPGTTNYIDNLDGNQAVYIFAVPQAGLFQDNNSIGGTNSASSHAFNAKFEVGKSYDLTFGVMGGGGGMKEGVTLTASLYYRDASSNIVPVSSITITNTRANFPTATHLVDYVVHVPAIKPDAAWTRQNIGILLISSVTPELQGGYWDVDNVRLTESVEVPNGSFESPVTPFVTLQIDSWEKTIKDQPGGQLDQLVGIFKNTDPGTTNYIDNMDGNQGPIFSPSRRSVFSRITIRSAAPTRFRLTISTSSSSPATRTI